MSKANSNTMLTSTLPTRVFQAPNGEDLAFLSSGDTFTVHGPTLAKQLGFREAKDMVRALADDEKTLVKGVGSVADPFDQGVWYVTEPGFYRIVGQRNVNFIKDEVVQLSVYRFQRWVFHEVLPQMMRAGVTLGLRPGLAWNWDEVSAQIRQRYGLDMHAAQITNIMRAAGWLKSGECTPKVKYRHHFWHSGSAFLLYPYALPVLVSDMVHTLRGLGDPRVQQEQLEFFPRLELLEGGAA